MVSIVEKQEGRNGNVPRLKRARVFLYWKLIFPNFIPLFELIVNSIRRNIFELTSKSVLNKKLDPEYLLLKIDDDHLLKFIRVISCIRSRKKKNDDDKLPAYTFRTLSRENVEDDAETFSGQ